MTNNDLPTDWDAQLAELGGTVLQSSAWAAFQARLERRVIWDKGEDWCWLGVIRRSRGGRYLDVPWGPTVRSSESENSRGEKAFAIAIQSLKQFAKVEKVDFIRVEPTGTIDSDLARSMGLVKVTANQPESPWILDLDQSEADLRHGLTSGHRSAINAAKRRGLSFRTGTSDDIEAFLALMKQTSARSKFASHPDDYFRLLYATLEPMGVATLYLAEADKQVVASSIVLDFGGVRYYAYAGADQAKNRLLQAAAPLVWRMITDAKAAGTHEFNFWGVSTSQDPKHAWAGFSTFKRAFGGRVEERMGTWELPMSPLKYRLLQLAKKVR